MAISHGAIVSIAAMLATAGAVAKESESDPAAEVRRVLEIENGMYSSYDLAIAARVYAPDIRWQNPFGVRFANEADLAQFLKRLFASPGFRSAKEISKPMIGDIRILGATSASAWSEEASEGQTYRDGKPVGPRKSHILYVLAKRQGRWLITDEMIMDEK